MTLQLTFAPDGGTAQPHGRQLQFETEACSIATWMKAMYWIFGAIWISLLFVWTASTFSPGQRRKGLRVLLFLLPLAQFGNCVVQARKYTVCPCLYCSGVYSEVRRARRARPRRALCTACSCARP